jgi:hypothetical protein
MDDYDEIVRMLDGIKNNTKMLRFIKHFIQGLLAHFN